MLVVQARPNPAPALMQRYPTWALETLNFAITPDLNHQAIVQDLQYLVDKVNDASNRFALTLSGSKQK